MSDSNTRRGFLTIAGTGAVTALAGCQGEPPESDTSESTDDGQSGGTTESETTNSASGPSDTLRLMSSGPIQSLDPINAKGSGAGFSQYGESLFTFPDGQYPPEPALVTNYEMSDDGLTYTFDLKEGVQFHDGTELTASDVVYSYRRLAGSSNSRNRDDIIGDTMTIEHEKDTSGDETTLEDYVTGSLAVEAVDDYTFEMTLRSPFEFTLSQIAGGAFAVLPEGSVGDIEGYDGEYAYNEFFSTENNGPEYAGLGAFAIDSWVKGNELTLTAFDGYHGEPAEISEITYAIISDGNTRLDRFRNGNADILDGMPTASFSPDNVSIESQEGNRSVGTYTLNDGTTVNYGEVPALQTEYIVFNTLEVPLPVRQAFAYAMNQHDIAENVYKGNATPGYHITPPAPYPTFEDGVSGSETYTRHAEDGYESNTEFGADGYPYGYGETRLDDATSVMEEAGYGDNNRVTITATTIAGSSAYASVFTRLQSKLRPAYIDIEIEEAEFGTIISRAVSGDMEVFALGDGMEYPGPQNFLRFLWGSNPGSQFTRWGAEGSYYDEGVRDLAIDAWESNYAAEDATSASRNEAFQTIEEVNWASVQELPTVHPTVQRFWHTDVDVPMYGVMEEQTLNGLTLSR